ncbi:hypothetical protein IRT45_35410 [Nocardia sp. BSTN01]|uniref:hypothetical protein n=1 Tax=Nocardia sp. BSTN01 TaxID=2783665 RepID=UPI00188E6EAE|nr:hypothetical protein [Nocardia sp. BSTN01]MBF5002407.1 hypothetical protein [Nocardia sp. BSTN01]
MTVITDKITDLAGLAEPDNIVFETTAIRQNAAGTQIVNTRRHRYPPDEDGQFTTDDLDPGPARVWIGLGAYDIEIPDYDSPVRLGPLIEAGLPVPAEEVARAVVNGGGVARIKAVSQSEFGELTSLDPETFYGVFPDP